MAIAELKKVIDIIPGLLNISQKRIWHSYDEEADVLYLNFKKPSHADDSKLTEDDMIIRYEKDEIVGITVINASKRRMSRMMTIGCSLAHCSTILTRIFNKLHCFFYNLLPFGPCFICVLSDKLCIYTNTYIKYNRSYAYKYCGSK